MITAARPSWADAGRNRMPTASGMMMAVAEPKTPSASWTGAGTGTPSRLTATPRAMAHNAGLYSNRVSRARFPGRRRGFARAAIR